MSKTHSFSSEFVCMYPTLRYNHVKFKILEMYLMYLILTHNVSHSLGYRSGDIYKSEWVTMIPLKMKVRNLMFASWFLLITEKRKNLVDFNQWVMLTVCPLIHAIPNNNKCPQCIWCMAEPIRLQHFICKIFPGLLNSSHSYCDSTLPQIKQE